MSINDIIDSIKKGKIRITDHADEEIHNDSLTFEEVFVSVIGGEIIEEYPDDKYSPSCLIYGRTKSSAHLHVQLSIPPTVVIITAYEPDESEWIDYRVRRKKE